MLLERGTGQLPRCACDRERAATHKARLKATPTSARALERSCSVVTSEMTAMESWTLPSERPAISLEAVCRIHSVVSILRQKREEDRDSQLTRVDSKRTRADPQRAAQQVSDHTR